MNRDMILNAINLITNSGADPNVTCDGWTPLNAAITFLFGERVPDLLKAGANVEGRSYGRTPLMWAANFGLAKTVQVLINANADVNAVGGENETAVILSAKLRFWDIARMLKENGAHRPSEEEELSLIHI